MVIEKLKQIVDSVGGLAFLYDDWNRVDKRADMLYRSGEVVPGEDKQAEGVLPACFVILPAAGQFDTRAANFRDAPELQVCFCIDADKDFDGLQNESLIEQMKEYARRFICAYNNSGLFEPLPEIIQYRPLYDILQANLTGIYLNIQAFELQGECYDYTEREAHLITAPDFMRTGYYIQQSTGNYIENEAFVATELLDVDALNIKSGDILTVFGAGGVMPALIAFYREDKTFISARQAEAQAFSVVVPTDTKYVAASTWADRVESYYCLTVRRTC